MSIHSHISLINLKKQFPFEIDETFKEKICFAETLLVSCCHHESYEDNELDLDSCEEQSAILKESEESFLGEAVEVRDPILPEEEPEEEVPEKDYLFYFFPDCNKTPPPQGSNATLIFEDGIPRINPKGPSGALPPGCTCQRNDKGECDCYFKFPCDCYGKQKKECTCENSKKICICDPDLPRPVCKCKRGKVCVCFDDAPQPVCKCDKIVKPCICGVKDGKFPCPVCKCKYKPKLPPFQDYTKPKEKQPPQPITAECVFDRDPMIESELLEEQNAIEELWICNEICPCEDEHEPCTCQKDINYCECRKGKDCIDDLCTCAFRDTCICGPPVPYDGEKPLQHITDTKCTCSKLDICECDVSDNVCKCFKQVCTCGDRSDCKCQLTCECDLPCVCDTQVVKAEEDCLCADPLELLKKELTCTCRPKKQGNKLKKVRCKHGYRWCPDVDPHHTFFDFGYGMHDKLDYSTPVLEKIKITDAKCEMEEEEIRLHGPKLPPFKKKVRKPTLDCCSTVGGITISVETLGEDKDRFLVQVVSNTTKEGSKTGSKLVSIIDINLHTMEENRSEYIAKKNYTKERRSYMGIVDLGYYNKITHVCGDKTVVKRIYRSFEDARNFLLEGANIVLLRYFALSRYRGTVRTDTVMIDGEICESVYHCLGTNQGVVNGKPMFVVKVERNIIEPNGNIHQTLTILSLRGYTISHEWADNCYVLHINPLLTINPEKDIIEEHAPLRENWRNDMQLLSDFIDMKSERTSQGGRYTTENSALSNLVREYLQSVLMLKPTDTLDFTYHYFKTLLSSIDLPHNEYFDPCARHVRYYFFEE